MKLKKWSETSSKTKGIIYLLLSAFSFAVMSLFVSLAGDMPVYEKAFFRNVIAVIVSLTVLAKSEDKFKVKKGSLPLLLCRATFGTVGIICNFYAISKINISDALILNKMSPFFAVIASIFILREIANGHQWTAIIFAIIGSVFVVKPAFIFDMGNSSSSAFPALIGLIGGVSAGVAYTFMRRLSLKGERSAVIVAFFSIFSCIALIPFIVFNFQMVTPVQLVFCLCAGVAACCGQLTITSAYAHCPAKEISVYDYSTVIFAAILGGIFLDQRPDKWSILGYIIIIGASVYSFLYNNGYLGRNKKSVQES